MYLWCTQARLFTPFCSPTSHIQDTKFSQIGTASNHHSVILNPNLSKAHAY